MCAYIAKDKNPDCKDGVYLIFCLIDYLMA